MTVSSKILGTVERPSRMLGLNVLTVSASDEPAAAQASTRLAQERPSGLQVGAGQASIPSFNSACRLLGRNA